MTLRFTPCIRIGWLVVLCFSLVACAAQQTSGPTAAGSGAPQELGEDFEVVRLDSLPGHARAALAVLLHGMRGNPVGLKHAVTMAPDGFFDFDTEFINLDGYAAYQVHVNDMVAHEMAPGVHSVLFEGFLAFRNDIGQRLFEEFVLGYTVHDGTRIVLNTAVAKPMEPFWPMVAGFFVDANALARDTDRLVTFEDYFRWAWDNAISMYPTPEEAKAMAAYESLSFLQKAQTTRPETPVEGDYAFMAFCMDRLPPDARFEVTINTSESGSGPSDAEPYYVMDQEGFVFGVARGQCTLHDSANRFYGHAFYTPGSLSDFEREEVQVGLFPSTKLYENTKWLGAPPGGEAILQAYIEAASGAGAPVSQPSASVSSDFLNPRSVEDAMKIQKRLAELGYYKGAIDGLFGPNSQSALQAFRYETMERNDAQWDMATQRALFQESTNPGLLNPDNRDDAVKIQTELAEKGFYSGAIDGLFGKNSKKSLRAFRKEVMGDDSYAWDMETQEKLFE